MDYQHLSLLTNEQLIHRDLAELNLLCARHLPGTENLDIQKPLRTLEHWTDIVRLGTNYALQNRDSFPTLDDLSESEYRIHTMFSVLYRHLGLTLNTEVLDPDYTYDGTDSRNNFIHAVLQEAYPATCCTAPVIFAAIGRRLGYPIKLVKTNQHIFCRWVGEDGERFNIEATNQGYYRIADEHYHNWPEPISQKAFRQGVFLTELSPRQEIALFLHLRGICLLWNLRIGNAVEAFMLACQLDPGDYFFGNELIIAKMFYHAKQEALRHFGKFASPDIWRIPSWCEQWGQSLHKLATRRLNSILKRENAPAYFPTFDHRLFEIKKDFFNAQR